MSAGGARILLFVYGTLRRDATTPRIERLVAGARRLGAATVRGRLHDLGPHPAARLDETAEGVVSGELLDLPEARLPALDAYEGIDPSDPARGLFRRERCRARLVSGPAPEEREAWIYVWNGDAPPGPVVPDGVWRPRRAAGAREREA